MQANGVDLQAYLYPILRLTAWLAFLTAVFVPLERLFAVHPRRVFRKGFAVDLAYYFISSLLPALLLGAPLALLAWVAHQYVPAAVLATTASLPFWGRSLVGLVASEIGYYWAHRLSHQIPFLWRFHAIHHSAEELDFLVNTRAHPMDMVWGRLCAMTPLYILGLGGPTGAEGSAVPVAVSLITTMWGFFVHANVRWRFGPLEWLISTPGFHHWHHTKTGPLNRNYASTLPWLDWLFGSLYLPRGEWPSDYGLKSQLPEDLMGQFFYPFEAPPRSALRSPKRVEPSPRPAEAENDETAVEVGGPTSTA